MTPSRPRLLLLLLALAAAAGPLAGAAAPGSGAGAEVPPGGVVRWSAPGTAGCAFASGGEPWEPVGET